MLRATIVAAACAASMAAPAQQRPIAADALRSGITYAGADIRAMQADDLANPGFLWVQRGEALFNENCTACHRDAASMRGVAARYPAYDPRRNRSSISKAASSSAAPGDSTSLHSDANPTTSCRSRRS